MAIVFFCQSCGARFEVDPRMAGKRGHCKKCGQIMMIPRAEEIASMTGMPALALTGAGAGRGMVTTGNAAASAGAASMASWLKGGLSGAALAPLSMEKMPRRPTRPSALDDGDDSKPYVLANPLFEQRGRVRSHNNRILSAWRRRIGGIQKLFRTINQTAYVISIPFIMILLLGIAVQKRPLALFGATFVVLVNIGRLVAGGANLAVVPLRDGINAGKMRKPLRRVIEPAITIGLVIAAFTFIPWLASDRSANQSLAGRIRSNTASLKKEMKGEIERVVDVDNLTDQANRHFNDLKKKANAVGVKNLVVPTNASRGNVGHSPAKPATDEP